MQREWLEKDYYAVLGVDSTASQKEVTSAYRKLARQFHPDANPGNQSAEDRFKEVSAAYEVVGDPEKRQQYDEVRRMGPAAGGFGGGFGGGFDPSAGGVRFDVGDLGDLLGGLFTRGRPGPGGPGGPGGRPGGSFGPRRGPDVTADLHVEFMEALRGATVSVNVDTTARCGDCHGSGAAAGTSPVTCSMCGGMGSVQENQGPFSFSRPCDRCGGAGQVIEPPCRTCGGTGAVRRPQQVKVRIPRGIRHEGRVRVKGRGGAGTNGGPGGDLFVTVHVRPHPAFRRDGDNLLLTGPVTFDELVLGADVELPTVEGESVTIRVPAGTRSGKKFRVRGKGVTTGKGTGDLVATVEVVVPAQVDDATRAAVEAYAAAAVGSPRDALRETVERVAGTAPTEESGAGDA